MEESAKTDSLYDGLLKYPQYTKPEHYKGYQVPEILLSGHHENIKKYREEQSIYQTFKKRPDLLASANLTELQKELYEKIKK